MIKLIPKIVKNQTLIIEKFISNVRQRFIEIYESITGKLPSSDFRLYVRSIRDRIFLDLDVGKSSKRNPLYRTIREDEFRNVITENEFLNKSPMIQESEYFKQTMDLLMKELLSLLNKAESE